MLCSKQETHCNDSLQSHNLGVQQLIIYSVTDGSLTYVLEILPREPFLASNVKISRFW